MLLVVACLLLVVLLALAARCPPRPRDRSPGCVGWLSVCWRRVREAHRDEWLQVRWSRRALATAASLSRSPTDERGGCLCVGCSDWRIAATRPSVPHSLTHSLHHSLLHRCSTHTADPITAHRPRPCSPVHSRLHTHTLSALCPQLQQQP